MNTMKDERTQIADTLAKYNIHKSPQYLSYTHIKDSIVNGRLLTKENLDYIQSNCSETQMLELIALYNTIMGNILHTITKAI